MSTSTWTKRGYDAFMKQPPLLIGLEIAFGIGVTYFAAKGIVKWIKKTHDEKMQRQVVKDANQEIKNLGQQGQNPSFADTQYSAWASQIKTAFDGCDPQSDDYDTVMRIMKQMKNDVDVLKLISAFGTATWDECGWFMGNVTGDLAYGIAHEINGISDINAVLSSKGIKFRF